MLRRNEGEMHFMPHIGYNLAKHLYLVATNTQINGIITVGGIVTKIARSLHLALGDDIVPGPTTIDITGLAAMKLIERSIHDEYSINVGPSTIRHWLPLDTDIDPLQYQTWKIIDPPEEPEEQAQHPPHAAPQPAPAAPPVGPSNQDLMDYMVRKSNSMNDMRLHFDRRMDEIKTEVQLAKYYAKNALLHVNPEFEEDPPTPLPQRRVGQAQDATRQAAMEAAAQAAAATASHDNAGDEEENDVEDDQ